MKWHDAKKEWPEDGECIFCITNNTQDLYKFFFGMTNNYIAYGNIKYEIVETAEQSFNRNDITHWCYVDDIPKPE